MIYQIQEILESKSAFQLFNNIKNNYPTLTSEIVKMKFFRDFLSENIFPTEITEKTTISKDLYQKINHYLITNYNLTK